MKKNNNYYHGSEKFNHMAEVRTYAALKEKHLKFAKEYEKASLSELLDYVRLCAEDLGILHFAEK